MEPFASVPEQLEAKRLLTAALAEGGAHAYLLHGPAGVGKRTAAFAFAGALLGDERRVLSRSHPDLYLLEPLGEMIRIDDIRALRHDLHMRPFEGDRRVYLVLDADRMNEDAADALLKDLEEPPLVRGDRARRRRARPAAADDPLALPARPVQPALGARGAGVDRRAGARAERGGGARAVARVRGATRPRAPSARPRRGRATRRAHRRGALGLSRARVRPGRAPRACCSARPASAGRRRASASRRSSTRSTFRRATRSSGCAARSVEPSGTSSSPGSRGSRRGIATSSSWQRAPRTPPSTRTGSTTCARTSRRRLRRRRRRRRRGGARDVAHARGVQPEPLARPRGAVRRASGGAFRRYPRGRRPRRLRSLGASHPPRPRHARLRGAGRRPLGREQSRAREEGGAAAIVSATSTTLPELDGVVVATTTSTHAAVVEERARARRPGLLREAAHGRPDAAARLAAARARTRCSSWTSGATTRACVELAAIARDGRLGAVVRTHRRRASAGGVRTTTSIRSGCSRRTISRSRCEMLGRCRRPRVGGRPDASTGGVVSLSGAPRGRRLVADVRGLGVSAGAQAARRAPLRRGRRRARAAAGTSTSPSTGDGTDEPRGGADRDAGRAPAPRSSCARSSSTCAEARRRSRAPPRARRSSRRSPSSERLAARGMTDATILIPTYRHAALLPYCDRERARPGGRVDRALRRRGRRRGRHARGRRRATPATSACASSIFRRGRGSGEAHRHPAHAAGAGPHRLLPVRRRPAPPRPRRRDARAPRGRRLRASASARFAADGTLQFFPWNYARPEFRDVARGRSGSIGLTGVAHTMEAYRRLPHGWRTTPEGMPTDHWMWLQFLELPGSAA